jgi:hypothetical protein
VVVVATIVIGAVGLRLLAARPGPPELPAESPVVCPTRPGVSLDDLLCEAAVLNYEVAVVEVVALDDDVIVGTTSGTYHLHLPWPFARRQALDRLHWWRLSGARLTGFYSAAHGLSGIADEDTGTFLCTAAGF